MIDAARLEEIFRDSLFNDVEVQELGHDPNLTTEHVMEMPENERPFVTVLGIVHNVAFHPGGLESHRDEVREMLDQLPDEFRASVGGGWSTLNMVTTRTGELWGEHRNMEQLATLAIGLGLGNWVLPREMWAAFPGGMPYFQYLDTP